MKHVRTRWSLSLKHTRKDYTYTLARKKTNTKLSLKLIMFSSQSFHQYLVPGIIGEYFKSKIIKGIPLKTV